MVYDYFFFKAGGNLSVTVGEPITGNKFDNIVFNLFIDYFFALLV